MSKSVKLPSGISSINTVAKRTVIGKRNRFDLRKAGVKKRRFIRTARSKGWVDMLTTCRMVRSGLKSPAASDGKCARYSGQSPVLQPNAVLQPDSNLLRAIRGFEISFKVIEASPNAVIDGRATSFPLSRMVCFAGARSKRCTHIREALVVLSASDKKTLDFFVYYRPYFFLRTRLLLTTFLFGRPLCWVLSKSRFANVPSAPGGMSPRWPDNAC